MTSNEYISIQGVSGIKAIRGQEISKPALVNMTNSPIKKPNHRVEVKQIDLLIDLFIFID